MPDLGQLPLLLVNGALPSRVKDGSVIQGVYIDKDAKATGRAPQQTNRQVYSP